MSGLPPSNVLEGHSLLDLIRKPNKKWKYPTLTFYGQGNVAIRDKKFRLIEYENGAKELYNMKKDPNERYNLVKDKKYRGVIQRLKKHIPKSWAPLSKYSKYNFNQYFIDKSK